MGIGGWVKFLPVQSMTSEAVQRQPLGHSEIVAAGDWNRVFHVIKDPITSPRTPRISGLKSQVLKPTFFELKMMVKGCLEFFILKFY